MRMKTAFLGLIFLLLATAFAGADADLGEVIQVGRFVLYRDHADVHKYYYVPDAPRLATDRDGTPEFSLIKYTKTDGTTKGGIVHFLVTWGFTSGELSSAESSLQMRDPEGKIAGPVPFKEGTFRIVSSTAGEGGLFNRRIVGEGKAPILPGQKAAVSIALTEEGASLLWESFKNPTSDVSVLFDLKFTGVTPAFEAKLKVDWDKVYTQQDIKLHAGAAMKAVKVEADVRAILEELRQKGAIQLDVVGENQNMQKMLDAVYTHLISMMCDKVPMGTGAAASPTPKTPAAPSTKQTPKSPPASSRTSPSSQRPPSGPGATSTRPATSASRPATQPEAGTGKAPEPGLNLGIQFGYAFKSIKLSGNYEVDMRKRLREDRDIIMSGNVSGVYQKYGEDSRFFTVVSLDDPTFQERSIEVILDSQDASDFKNYVNSVSVLFRKARFSGAPVTGEVKFFDEQFAQTGSRQSFKYGRLNEAATEWLDYEFKPKWTFYGGVTWEGEWTKTSDSVLTLSPPVERRTLEISADEDNLVKNGIKALAVQVKHRIYGTDITKEVVINYDKGDPLQVQYTYLHEPGRPGYTYKVVWLFTDGREIQTDWISKESPFVYVIYTK